MCQKSKHVSEEKVRLIQVIGQHVDHGDRIPAAGFDQHVDKRRGGPYGSSTSQPRPSDTAGMYVTNISAVRIAR